MIELQNTSRWYGQVIGVNDVTATIRPGITALLGMNGSGKTTLIRLITGQLRPTTGHVLVHGMEPFANPEVFKRLGYCPEIDNFYEHYSGRRFVNFMARLSGLTSREAANRTEELLHWVGMSDRTDRSIKGYSKGMRQRIKLAQAMVANPDILLLDEPLNGLDPVGRHEFMSVLESLADQGKTIMVSSHILFEVEQMTRSLLLLHRGRLLATGDLQAIRQLIDKHPHKVRIEAEDARGLASRLSALPNVISLRIGESNEELDLEVNDPDSFYESLTSIAVDEHWPISSFNSPDNNLESVFRYLVEA